MRVLATADDLSGPSGSFRDPAPRPRASGLGVAEASAGPGQRASKRRRASPRGVHEARTTARWCSAPQAVQGLPSVELVSISAVARTQRGTGHYTVRSGPGRRSRPSLPSAPIAARDPAVEYASPAKRSGAALATGASLLTSAIGQCPAGQWCRGPDRVRDGLRIPSRDDTSREEPHVRASTNPSGSRVPGPPQDRSPRPRGRPSGGSPTSTRSRPSRVGGHRAGLSTWGSSP